MTDQSIIRPALGGLFSARSLVLVGATERSFWSNTAFGNCDAMGFAGDIHLVNPKGGTIYGKQAFRSCVEISRPVDAALVMVPASMMMKTFDDLQAAGICNAVMLTSGFAEMGEEGRRRQQEVSDYAARRNISLLGPNCLGFLNLLDRVPIWTSTLPQVKSGSIAVVSQSGATASYIADFAAQQGVGIGYLISTGNEAGVTVAAAIDHVIDDPRIRVVAAFIETVRESEILIGAAKRAAAMGKAIVALKIGSGELTAKAAQAHTGSLVGDDGVFSAACKRYGIVRVSSIEELVITADILARVDLPTRPGLALAAISGGVCEIASDRADAVGAPLRPFSPDTLARLGQVMPEFGTSHNPLDVTGAAVLDPGIFTRALDAIVDDPEIGMAAVIFDVPEQTEGIGITLIKAIGQVFDGAPIPAIVLSTSVRPVTPAMQAVAEACGIRFFGSGVDYGLSAIGHSFRLAANRIKGAAHAAIPMMSQPASARPRSEAAALAYLASRGVPTLSGIVVSDEGAAVAEVARLRCPAAFKIASPDIQHKSDIGGVILDVNGEVAARDAFCTIMENARKAAPGAQIDGILISPMRQVGLELFAGVVRDPQWGLALMVGLGGIWIEALKDTSMRLLPVTENDVLEMLGELKSSRLLDGFRGAPAADRQRIASAIVAIGDAAIALGPDLVSLEVNPLAVSGEMVEALDALAIWSDAAVPE